MANKVILLIVLVGACAALPRPDERLQQYEAQQYRDAPQYKPSPYKQEPGKPYAFDYGVRDDYSGANFGHSETSNGNSVEGTYQVALPDGRIQTVKYIADHENGFQAQVSYEGEARYPEHKPAEQSYKHEPSYKSEPKPYKQPLYRQPKPAYKSVPQYHPNEPQQQQYQEAAEEVQVYQPEIPEYQ